MCQTIKIGKLYYENISVMFYYVTVEKSLEDPNKHQQIVQHVLGTIYYTEVVVLQFSYSIKGSCSNKLQFHVL